MRFRNTAHSLVRKVFCFRCLEIWRFGVLAEVPIFLRNKRCSLAQQRGGWLLKAVGGVSLAPRKEVRSFCLRSAHC